MKRKKLAAISAHRAWAIRQRSAANATCTPKCCQRMSKAPCSEIKEQVEAELRDELACLAGGRAVPGLLEARLNRSLSDALKDSLAASKR
jgi:hypothetical protein